MTRRDEIEKTAHALYNTLTTSPRTKRTASFTTSDVTFQRDVMVRLRQMTEGDVLAPYAPTD